MQMTFFIMAAGLYLCAAFLPLHRTRLISASTVLAWIFHGASLASDVIGPNELHLGFAVVLSATLWISAATYWLENRNFALDGLRVLMLPVAAAASLLPLMFPGPLVNLAGKSDMFSWHIAIAILAYSTLTIAAFHAVLMAVQESYLHAPTQTPKTGWFAVIVERLPALMAMERLLFRLIGFGFILLTLTVLSGIIFSEEIFGRPLKWDHKTIFTLTSWALFGILLAGRKWRGWRGKTALTFTLGGFATLFLAYVGTRFVLEVVLHRSLA